MTSEVVATDPKRGRTLAVVGLIFSCLFFLPLFGIIGIVLGVIALVRIPQGQPRGLAVAAVGVGFTGTFVITGIIAAIAIPAFQRYVDRSKTVEATMNVRRLADSVIALEAASEKPITLASSDWTPPNGACGAPGAHIPSQPNAWGHPFTDLEFDGESARHFQYRVQQTGTLVTVEARGDLNCNGVFSNFRREIRDGQQTRGLIIANELE